MMVKIRIYIVFEILFLAKAIEKSKVTLCENSEQRYKNLTCPENNTISWKSIIYGESPCQDANNKRICLLNIDTYFNDHCLGQNNCTLPIDILSNNSCQPPPRRLKVKFKCAIDWWPDNYRGYVDTCANSLAQVKCSSGFIRIQNVKSYSDAGRCDEMKKDCVKNHIKHLCDYPRSCSKDTTKDSCLFHKRFATIDYVCKSPSDPEVTESIPGTTSDHELDMTTISTSNTITESDRQTVLKLDDNHRLEIYQHSLNRKLYLCSLGWDDNDAGVLCKSLNKTWIGNATFVNKLLDIPTLPNSLNCDGHESSLLACNFTEDENGCNTTTVAGAVCCQGTGIPGECVKNPSYDKLASVKSGFPTLGVAVGVPVGIIGIICIIVAVVFIRRRCIREHSDKTFSNFMNNTTDENYSGQQDIALPQYPTNNKVLYSQVPNRNTDTIKNEDGQDNSHPSKDPESPYTLSEEGVYDKTNERRHVVNDTDMYSRTVDTVYDSAEQHMKQDRKEETYDHVFGQKTEDYYDQTTRT
ncbi:unnamed protein product [Mytilus coruscus]|uniref:SRCR domain-containing protein n=1 Tax=Mytilus coruscus TaxID=42192 RepID=A0A6J8DRJ5_MYTCO|nr:unnamed protein product [Mytilus coruscus]